MKYIGVKAMLEVKTPKIFDEIKNILEEARAKTYKAVNIHIVDACWEIVRIIVQAQDGKNTAKYGKGLITELSK